MNYNNKNGIVTLVTFAVISMTGYAIFNHDKSNDGISNWMELTRSIVESGNIDAYSELIELYPESIETLPYSIIMATKYKYPVAFFHAYKKINRIDESDILDSIATKCLEYGIQYDTIDQVCLLELIKKESSKTPIDSVRLMSYIYQLKGVDSDSARLFLYHKTIGFYEEKSDEK